MKNWTLPAVFILLLVTQQSFAQFDCNARSAVQSPTPLSIDGWGGWFNLNDGRAARIVRVAGRAVLETTADGETWERRAVDLSRSSLTALTPLQMPNGDILAFALNKRCEDDCRTRLKNYFLDIVVTRLRNDGTVKEPTRTLWDGYTGDLRRAILFKGKVILPFAAFREGRPRPPDGIAEIKLLISDDGGVTFRLLEPNLRAPVGANLRAPGFGAIEPSIGIKPDGTLLMLMRTQADELWQSTSLDGETWSAAKPSGLPSPSAPGFLIEYRDGLVLLWNDTYQPSRHQGKMLYGGRDVLHAALFRDGRWLGWRQVLADNKMLEVIDGDAGTAYPVAVTLPNGGLLVASGQEKRRVAFKFDPEWLAERTQGSAAPDSPHWIGFEESGPVVRYKRPRTPTVTAGEVTRLVAPAADGAAAILNFPLRRRGAIDLKLTTSGGRTQFALLDRFINPYDPAVPDIAKAIDDLPSSGGLLNIRWDGKTVTTRGRTTPMKPNIGVNHILLKTATAAAIDGVCVH